ncbi:MAG TPA: nucleotide exchange factor GrpE, partial [Anaeromyxobacteraceae bacterium]|nr:nucleotide exchange factor GrpE [Anaeromyxobacteraceae bacterium]
MPQDGRDRPGAEGAGGQVKVVDRRRFREDGDPVEHATEGAAEAGVAPAQPGGEAEAPDARDTQLAA